MSSSSIETTNTGEGKEDQALKEGSQEMSGPMTEKTLERSYNSPILESKEKNKLKRERRRRFQRNSFAHDIGQEHWLSEGTKTAVRRVSRLPLLGGEREYN